MKKITKLKICNWGLLVLTIAILISGIQLEAIHSNSVISVWIHILIGILFMGMVVYHVFLHFGTNDWLTKIRKQKSRVMSIMWWVTLASLVTGIASMVHWFATFSHAHIGGVHGKLGFLMIILSLGHICKRIKFFRSKAKKSLIGPVKASM